MAVFTDRDLKIIEDNLDLSPKDIIPLLEGNYSSVQITKKKNYIKNKEKYLKQMTNYRQTSNYKKSQKKWREANAEYNRQRNKKWREDNHSYDLQRRRDYRLAIKEKYNIPDRWGGKHQALVQGYAEEILNCKAKVEYKFEWLISDKGYAMPVDIYFPEYNLIIEYNGQQHYMPIDFGGGSDDAVTKFKSQIKRDKLKYRLIREHKIQLLVIPYNMGKIKIQQLILEIKKGCDANEQTDYERCLKKSRIRRRKKQRRV